MKQEDWDKAAGIVCPECGQEVFRLINGICFKCSAEKQRIKEINRLSRKFVNLSRQGKEVPEELIGKSKLIQGLD